VTRPDRWEKAADRDLARRQRDAGPLFAPHVARRDPEAVRARAERIVDAHMTAIRDFDVELERRGQEARATLAAHVSAADLAELDRRRAWYPPSGGYTADHYCGECRKRGLPWPGKDAYDALWAEVRRQEAIEAEKARARAAAAGEQLALPTGVRIRLPRARIEELTPDEQEALEAAIGEAAEAEAAVTRATRTP
jgi:hypothetical protein